jgi:hypothetical protein
MVGATPDPFWWGAIGGAIASACVFVLPGYIGTVRLKKSWVTYMGGRTHILQVVFLIVFLSGVAGTIALIPDNVTRGHAIEIGLGVEGFIKTLVASGKEALFPEQEKELAEATT